MRATVKSRDHSKRSATSLGDAATSVKRRLAARVLMAALSIVAAGTINVADAQSSQGKEQGIEPAVLAGSCSNCHGTDGSSPGSIPSIAGVPYATLKAQLEGFKATPSPDATVMPRLMRGYDADQIEILARYFSTVKAGARP